MAAVGSVVLLACGEAGEPPVRGAAPDSADQVLFGMRSNLTADGVQVARIYADTAYNYQDSQTSDLIGVRVQFFSAQGELTSTVESKTGVYYWRSQDMEARGEVVATTPDGRELTTEFLRYDNGTQNISGTEPFVFTSPDRELRGAAFTSDPDFQNVVVTRPERGRVDRQRP